MKTEDLTEEYCMEPLADEFTMQLWREVDDMWETIEPSITEVMRQGALKHGLSSWKEPENPSLQHKTNHNSLFHHISESYCNQTIDSDSGQHPLAHVVVRCLMAYYRDKKLKDVRNT